MGVVGLTHYVSTIAGLHKSIKVKNQRIVFDGSALTYYLYRHFSLDQRCGGQYLEYQAIILEFFKTIKKCGVVPYVIIDGHRNLKKSETVISRRSTTVRQVNDLTSEGKKHHYTKFNVVLPIFARDVLVRCLRSLDIIFFVAHQESDTIAVILANFLRCPVIGQDSDFYIYPLEYGYIPLDSIEYVDGYMLCSVFFRRCLAAHLKVKEALLPAFACLVGNDFISRERLRKLYSALGLGFRQGNKNFGVITAVAGYLSPYKSVDQVWASISEVSEEVEVNSLLSLFKEIVDDYNIQTKNPVKLESLESSFESAADVSRKLMLSLNNSEPCKPYFSDMWLGLIEPWIVDVVLCKANFLPVQVERINGKSAHSCSLNLRRKLYSILFINWQVLHNADTDAEFEVQEYDRQNNNYSSKIMRILPDIYFISIIEGNGSLKNVPLGQRKTMLLEAMSLKADAMEQINGLHTRHLLFALSLKFWTLNCRQKDNLHITLTSILITAVRLIHGRWKSKMPHYSFNVNFQHMLAQWQSVLYFTKSLNVILDSPFEELDICCYYNGVLLHHCAAELKTGKSVEDLLKEEEMEVYQELVAAVKPEFICDNNESFSSSDNSLPESDIMKGDVCDSLTDLKGNRYGVLAEK